MLHAHGSLLKLTLGLAMLGSRRAAYGDPQRVIAKNTTYPHEKNPSMIAQRIE